MTDKVFHLLILCTGNSCRSQMAEGWARELAGQYGDGWLSVESAGIEAHGKNSRAITMMADAGLDISNQESTRLTDEMLARTDLVVSVCGHADEHCPLLPAGTRKIHWPLDDPAKAEGTEAEIMNVFKASRDDIHRRVDELLNELKPGDS
jgi:arsenate reductase